MFNYMTSCVNSLFPFKKNNPCSRVVCTKHKMVTLNLCLLHVIAKYRQSLPLYSSLSKSIRPFYYFLDSDAGRDWGQEEKGMTEDEMAGWHH